MRAAATVAFSSCAVLVLGSGVYSLRKLTGQPPTANKASASRSVKPSNRRAFI